MCKIIIKDVKQNADFILYNHIFSHDEYRFTIEKLLEELSSNYNLKLEPDYLKTKINTYVDNGLINRNFRDYTISGK